ncbi:MULTISPECIES: hypothetical protein [Cobetia]|uniref:hypothetical protein n=1 Tax=Cobetia TaxID=204286 RepID=UPI003298256C
MSTKSSAKRLLAHIMKLTLCVFGALALGYASDLLPEENHAIPTVLMAIFLFPLTITIQLMHRLKDLGKMSGLSRSEFRRVNDAVEQKTTILRYRCGLHVFIAIAAAMIFFASSLPKLQNYIFTLFFINGFLISYVVIKTMDSINEINKVSDFEAKIKRRSDDINNAARLLKKLDTNNEK